MRGLFLILLIIILTAVACNFQVGEPSSVPDLTLQAQVTTVTFISPALNSKIAEGASIVMAAKINSPQLEAASVEFLQDGNLLGVVTAPAELSSPTWTARLTWQALGSRGYFLSAVAKRADGTTLARAEITVQVEAAALAELDPAATPSTTGDTAKPTAVAVVNSTSTLRAGVPTNTPKDRAMAGTSPISEPYAQVLSSSLTLRSGPGSTFTILATMVRGDQAAILGHNGNRTWWFVQWGTQRGWMTGNTTFVSITGDTANIPFVTTDSTPLPSPTPLPAGNLLPTSTAATTADLVIDSVTLNPTTPKANQTFAVTILVRNQGVIDAPSSLINGLFQPGNERSDVAVPALAAGQSITVTMYVTLQRSGANQVGALLLDVNNEVSEGANGEANNVKTLTYNID